MTVETSHSPGVAQAHRPIGEAIWRGFKLKCPKCGTGALSRRYLKIADQCNSCGEELHHQRADDAPPYFTMFLVGHLVVPPMLLVEKWYQPNVWLQVAFWLPLAALLCVVLLPRVKGGLVGLQWALRMGGFGEEADGSPDAVENRFDANGSLRQAK